MVRSFVMHVASTLFTFILADPKEKARIEAAGGVVIKDRVAGPCSAINMSRAMGDFLFKTPMNMVLYKLLISFTLLTSN